MFYKEQLYSDRKENIVVNIHLFAFTKPEITMQATAKEINRPRHVRGMKVDKIH